ncbi:MFS transporter [Leifsonia shinshuensis]|uniref:MFS transporter n=1 Tax=Leifsonia shinshuensis TaxID=150026 RepID=UPI001F50C5F2|nr:MFS transporter [Leifsonia shinshuensis]
MSESHPQPEPQPEEEPRLEVHPPAESGHETEQPLTEEQATVTEAAVRVQRSPRYFRFMITGAVVFAVIALILTYAFPENPTYDRGAVFGFLLAICATVGVALGALVALLIDRAATRRARTVQADRIDVRLPDSETDSPSGSEPSDPRPSDQRPSVDS